MNIADVYKYRKRLLGNGSLSEGRRNLYSKQFKTAAGCNLKGTLLLFPSVSLVTWASFSCLRKIQDSLEYSFRLLKGHGYYKIWMKSASSMLISQIHQHVLIDICVKATALSLFSLRIFCTATAVSVIHDKCQNIFNSHFVKRQ